MHAATENKQSRFCKGFVTQRILIYPPTRSPTANGCGREAKASRVPAIPSPGSGTPRWADPPGPDSKASRGTPCAWVSTAPAPAWIPWVLRQFLLGQLRSRPRPQHIAAPFQSDWDQQARAQLALDLLHRAAQCGLSDAEPSRCSRKAQLLCHRLKISEMS